MGLAACTDLRPRPQSRRARRASGPGQHALTKHLDATGPRFTRNKPKAENKEKFSVAGDFPVQNGRANFSLTLTANFQPSCSPPMEVVWGPITVTDTEHNVSTTIRL